MNTPSLIPSQPRPQERWRHWIIFLAYSFVLYIVLLFLPLDILVMWASCILNLLIYSVLFLKFSSFNILWINFAEQVSIFEAMMPTIALFGFPIFDWVASYHYNSGNLLESLMYFSLGIIIFGGAAFILKKKIALQINQQPV